MENFLNYQPVADRYERMPYKYCGKSGLQLPLISLGLWHNFGSVDNFEVATDMIKFAFDHGITHFDLANNYGPESGAAEMALSWILKDGIVTTVLAGASKTSQIPDNIKAVENTDFSDEEIKKINDIAL